MAVDNSRASVASAPARAAFFVSLLADSVLTVRVRRLLERAEAAADRHAGSRSFPVRARDRRAERQGLVHGPRVFPAAGRQLSAEPLPRRRQARHRRYAPRRGHHRRLRAGDQRVQGVPVAVPDPQARGLRAVQAGDVALLPDARPDAGSDRNRGSDQGADGVRRAVSRAPSGARSIPTPRPSSGKPGTASATTSWASACSTTSRGGIRARSSG